LCEVDGEQTRPIVSVCPSESNIATIDVKFYFVDYMTCHPTTADVAIVGCQALA